LIGRINAASDSGRVLFLGPGRWCTSSPDLGIPADVSELSRAAVIGEIVAMREGLVPEVSRGSHLLNELVARDILYLAIFPGKPHNDLNEAIFERLPNRLTEAVPGSDRWRGVVAVADASFEVIADVKQQRAVGFAVK
jgi:pyruvate, water dikinase